LTIKLFFCRVLGHDLGVTIYNVEIGYRSDDSQFLDCTEGDIFQNSARVLKTETLVRCDVC